MFFVKRVFLITVSHQKYKKIQILGYAMFSLGQPHYMNYQRAEIRRNIEFPILYPILGNKNYFYRNIVYKEVL